jgi:adenosine deaminase
MSSQYSPESMQGRSDALEMLLFGASILITQASSHWYRRTGNEDRGDNKPLSPRTGLVRYLSNYSRWSHYSDEEEAFIREVPKVELHVHLDGSFDPDVLWDFLQSHPERMERLPTSIVNPPWDPATDELLVRDTVRACRTSRDYHALCTCRGRHSLTEMLNAFQMFTPLVQGNLSLLEQLAYDFCRRQSQQNIVYTEARYSPHLLAYGAVGGDGGGADGTTTTGSPATNDDVGVENGCAVSALDVVHAITRGLRRGTADYGNIVVNQILCAISWRPDWAASVVEMAELFRDDYPCAVVGVDIAAGEEHFDPTSPFHGPHVAMAQTAQAKNIPMTLHAGEIPQQAEDHIRRAVTEYHARRIGHGYRMADRPETMQLIRDRGVHVEACLTSSVETGGWVVEDKNVRQWSAHPARTMLDQGVSLSFSSDDPAVFHTSLSWQYRTALAKMKTTPAELIRTNLDAIDAAFCSDKTKRGIKQLLVAFADERGVPGFALERSEHGLSPDQRQTLLKKQRTTEELVFTDRVYLANTEYS